MARAFNKPPQSHLPHTPPTRTMATQLPSHALKRVSLPRTSSCACQTRNASLLKRPHRPYTFTQLVTLSDGSTYTSRTTSPLPIFKSTKDTRNHPLWQPSLDSLRNVEQDEAGRLRAFRERFGRGWDLDAKEDEGGEGDTAQELLAAKEGRVKEEPEESLMDLISEAAGMAPRAVGGEKVEKLLQPAQSRNRK